MKGTIMSEKSIEIKLIEQKANEILKNVPIKKYEMLRTDDIIKSVEKESDSKIKIFIISFKKELSGLNDFGNMGAISKMEKDDKQFIILLNSDKNPKYQRFSLVHELGHLVLESPNIQTDDYVMSTHINYNITHIDGDFLDCDQTFINEEKANIFALYVLMPKREFEKTIMEYGKEKTAEIFGVSLEAVESRIFLSDKEK